MQHAFRSINECRVRSALQQFNGRKLMICKYTTGHSSTEYYIELMNARPCVVTYVNNKRVDIRCVRDL
jgi:hypothetical protein